jgi:hypothetical protein
MTLAVLVSMAVTMLATAVAVPEDGGKMKPLFEAQRAYERCVQIGVTIPGSSQRWNATPECRAAALSDLAGRRATRDFLRKITQ